MRKYPIGLQSFREIREGNFVYVDKTKNVFDLVSNGDCYTLNRPDGFGKSLLLSTIKELYLGNRELFKGLWIESRWNWERKRKVIHFQFSQLEYQTLGLYEALSKRVDEIAIESDILLNETHLIDRFRELIKKAYVKERPAVLIDDYDKPLLDCLHDLPKLKDTFAILKNFYSVLAETDDDVRMLFITGITNIGNMTYLGKTPGSLFYSMSKLYDITLVRGSGNILGITQEELELNFPAEIARLQQDNPLILDEIKNWYGGYSWDNETRVYNPFSLLRFMAEPVFRNYWFAEGPPAFLVKLLKEKSEYKFDQIQVEKISLSSFDMAGTVPAPLLFHTGYLTSVKAYCPLYKVYTLCYPNWEVKASLLKAFSLRKKEVKEYVTDEDR